MRHDWRMPTLAAIDHYRQRHGWPPTIRDIAAGLGKSTDPLNFTVCYRMRKLRVEGLIDFVDGQAGQRTTHLTDKGWVALVDWKMRNGFTP